jgi:hypothetical protein
VGTAFYGVLVSQQQLQHSNQPAQQQPHSKRQFHGVLPTILKFCVLIC